MTNTFVGKVEIFNYVFLVPFHFLLEHNIEHNMSNFEHRNIA